MERYIPFEFPKFEYPMPETREAWEEEKIFLRDKLRRLLGNSPPLFTPEPEISDVKAMDGFRLETLRFDNGIGHTVFGYLAVPEGRDGPGPAVLYHHYHGDEYGNGKEEFLKPWITAEPPAKALTDAGYTALCIDAYGFGERQRQGPAGERESGERTEAALFKTFLWQGRTLWGMMVRDDQLALNYLVSRPEVDAERVGAIGMSMGSTRTWWLAALDSRVKAPVCVACLTRYQNLIEHGEINQHGIYYFVPNLLQEGVDAEAIVASIAPRPLLTLTGGRDAGSPLDGVEAVNDYAGRVYDLYGDAGRFEGMVYPKTGHEFTPEMWDKAMAWLERWLKE